MNLNKLFILIFVLLVVACDDRLDIEPEQSLSIDASFSDESTSRASLSGVYSQCQDLDVFGAMPQIINDFMADNVDFIGSFPTLIDIRDFQTITDNATVAGIFRDHYQAILGANSVITFVPDVQDDAFSPEERNVVIGEAKFLRAMLYHNLVTLFGQPYTVDGGSSLGVSLITTPDALTGGDLLVPRSTVAETYTLIESDLNDAIAALPDSGARVFASKGAAQALLSRVELYKGQYGQAASLAGELINNSNYTLAADYSFYNNETPEDIFSLQMTAIDNSRTGSGGWASFYNPAEAGARGDCPFSADLLADFDQENDLRFLNLSQIGQNMLTYTTKFPDATNNTDNAPLIRITEMYLTRAEALAEVNGVNQESVDLINQLRTRAGLSTFTTSDFADGAALVDQILDERRKELCFEGHRRNDLLRKGKELREGDNNTAPGATRVVLPIPQREIDLGSSTPQNLGY